MNKGILSVVLVFAVVVLSSCTRNEAPAPDTGTPTTPKGRAETRVVEALDAVGYQADKVRKSVDSALDAADEKIQQTQDLLDE